MIHKNIDQKTNQNENFREVVFTNKFSQFVLMSLLPGEEIGLETHGDIDQILYFTAGSGIAILDGAEHAFAAGDVVNVPAGTSHNIVNSGDEQLKLFTVYSPPEHPDGTVHATKADADADHHDH